MKGMYRAMRNMEEDMSRGAVANERRRRKKDDPDESMTEKMGRGRDNMRAAMKSYHRRSGRAGK